MNKLVAIAVTLALSVVPTMVLADDGNFFVNADAGQANYRINSLYRTNAFNAYDGDNLDKRDAAGALRFGYRWHSVVDYGVEAGYADLGQVTSTLNTPYGNKNDLKSRGWLLGGNLKYNIHDQWYVSARGGWFRSRLENKGALYGSPNCLPTSACSNLVFVEHYNNSSTGTGEYLGIGAGYNFSPNFSLGLSYDNYHARPNSSVSNSGIVDGINVALYSVSAEYRF